MDCPQEQQATFFTRITAGGARIPLAGSIEVTQRCNLRCVHCFEGDLRLGREPVSELGTDEIMRILGQAAEAGCLSMLLTGGEPLLRNDLPEIYVHAKRLGLLVTLFTNGTLITPRFADFLVENPPFGVEISLYGATPESYEKVTGQPGSYDRCMRGIHLLIERKIPLKLKTVLLTLNYSELDQMREISRSLGLERFRYDPSLVAGFDHSDAPLKYRLSPEKIVELDMADPSSIKDWEALAEGNHLSEKPEAGSLYRCGAAKNTFHIDSFGRLSACMLSRQRTFDLRTGSFKQGWDDFLRREASLSAPSESFCNTCNKSNLCVKCAGRTELEPQVSRPDQDFFCRIGHLRAAAIQVHSSKAIIGGISQ